MSKNHRYTEADLHTMGLIKNKDGNYESINKGVKPKWTFEKDANMVVRQPAKETDDFKYTIKTEWFIKGYSVPSKKNSRQNFVKNGKQISIPSKQHAEYKKMTAMQYSIFGIEFRGAIKALGLSYPIRVEFTFIRTTKHRFDYCNACQTVEDLMVENKWIEDDSADHIVPVFAQYEYDKNNGGVKIRLLK